MWTILQIELFKIFKRPRTYIAFVAIAVIVFLIQLAFYVDGGAYISFLMQSIESDFHVEGKILNGYFICYFILQTLLIHVPLLIALIGGDMIAGEANMGTLRLLISKPISRASLITGKFIATMVYTLLLLVWMAILSLGLSMLIFGTDDLLLFKGEEVVLLLRSDILWRYVAAFGFAAIAMTTVAALSFFLSLFAENSIGPIVSTMSVVIVFTILTSIDLPLFNAMKPYLFTSHMLGWKGFFDDDIFYNSIARSAIFLLAHIGGLLGLSLVIFKKKDVLS
ncbi:ABC transporter permease [Pseudobacter ginsenosidimutans]|uniref:ABC-2 type transport system permease protein n=1 Tax=Pseudobacter ginsenosidimutans TaxID=661488 RepID=A0A4Q7MR41_9BACT|nr:ABC transporter permease subunit [Pseudobacter ginsenosidimutans]QEC41950.1 ABC transporter permease subunit [Pseudobacter ginsenosidimutans]RZS71222.1 ABC-2 type transport system permease protein [Pseudobacter ginsenosidimutans]